MVFATSSRLSGDSQPSMENTFFKSHTVNVQQANMTVVNEANHFRALESLRDKCSLAALVDSKQRYDAPRCAEDTRIHISRKMENWVLDVDDIKSENSPASVFWLHGGAGVGKSALAQSLAEKFEMNGELAASFFFFKTDWKRNDGNSLIPTLAYQLTRTFQGLAPLVEAKIRDNPDLFEKNRRTQMLKLIVEPLIWLSVEETNNKRPDPGLKNHPRLIVIDGLDECLDTNVQCDLLRIIADASIHLPYPLRFLIASRPESHITRVFEHDLPNSPERYNLSDDLDADKDIQIFLEQQFNEICRSHPLGPYLPLRWPLESVIGSLVERSSSHFIYASTVIRFIQSPKHRPDDRLQVILGLQQPHEKDQPYAPLDSLYRMIFSEVEDGIEQIWRVFGIIHLRSLKTGLFGWKTWACDRSVIEELLGLRPGDLILLFDPLLSLVAFDKDDIRIYHKTLFDYLLDSDRSGDNVLDLSLAHEAAMKYLLGQKDPHKNAARLQIFVYHSQFASLDNDTIRYLQFLASNTRDVHLGLSAIQKLQTILYFLQVLNRPDFDSGHWYKKFVKSQTKNFSSRVRWTKSIPHKSRNSTKFADVRSLFLPLTDITLGGSLCGRANGCYRGTAVPAIDQSVLRSIEKEHEMFSLLLKIHHPVPEDVFSLMQASDDHLYHSCHFATRSDLGDMRVTCVVIMSYTKDGVRLACSKFTILEQVELLQMLKHVTTEHLQNTQQGLLDHCTKVITKFFPHPVDFPSSRLFPAFGYNLVS